MNSEELGAADPPTSIDPYVVLSVPSTASATDIKSAYKKIALRIHPDKAPVEQREAAHVRFQELAFAYAILGDEKRRARYDRTGSTAETVEDDDSFDWADFFRSQYAEHVTADKIKELKSTYQGSEEERTDVLKAYKLGKGNLDKVFEEVMLSSVLEDEGRIRGYIDEAINSGEIEALEKYTNESEKKKKARRDAALKEQKEAEEAADEMGIHDEVFGDGHEDKGKRKKTNQKAKAGRKKDIKGSEADLAALIQRRHAGRAEAFFDNLTAKYSGSTRQQKRKIDEPGEEAFIAMAKRGKKGKENKSR